MEKRTTDVIVAASGAGILIASSIMAISAYARSLGAPFFDWTFYAGAVNRWLAGEQIYPGARISTLGAAAGSGYAYPPASVPFMLPFAHWPIGAILWETLVIGVFVFGLWKVVQIGWPKRPLLVFGVVLAVCAMLDGVMQGVAVGNVNIATAGALGLIWARPRSAAWIGGVLAVVKVFPIALSAPAGVRALAKAAGLAVAACLVTLPLVGLSSWADYITGLQKTQPLCGDPMWLNYSLGCQVSPFLGLFVAKWIGLLIAAGLMVIALRAGTTFVGFAAAGLAILAPAAELHAHYLAIILMLGVIGFASLNMRASRQQRNT